VDMTTNVNQYPKSWLKVVKKYATLESKKNKETNQSEK
jgi:hypothetical protein